jgi:RNA polymerase sigma-70 factor (ECF subfamily)
LTLTRKQNAFADTPIDEMDDRFVSEVEPMEESLIKLEEYETIKKHISTLDEKSRSVLEMKYLLDMSYKEIGEALGMTPKHVDTTIMRAKAKVRKIAREGSEG